MRFVAGAVGLLMLLGGPAVLADSPNDILVISNRSVSVDKISLEDLRDVFLKKRKDWNKGGRAVPINAKPDSSLREKFRDRVINMTASEEERYWQDRKIKFGTKKPADIGNRLKIVFKVKGAVSYVFRSEYKKGVVKVLLEIPAKP